MGRDRGSEHSQWGTHAVCPSVSCHKDSWVANSSVTMHVARARRAAPWLTVHAYICRLSPAHKGACGAPGRPVLAGTCTRILVTYPGRERPLRISHCHRIAIPELGLPTGWTCGACRKNCSRPRRSASVEVTPRVQSASCSSGLGSSKVRNSVTPCLATFLAATADPNRACRAQQRAGQHVSCLHVFPQAARRDAGSHNLSCVLRTGPMNVLSPPSPRSRACVPCRPHYRICRRIWGACAVTTRTKRGPAPLSRP